MEISYENEVSLTITDIPKEAKDEMVKLFIFQEEYTEEENLVPHEDFTKVYKNSKTRLFKGKNPGYLKLIEK
ncbi:hypothetical protein [Treponema sp.]|uniref:hypothetical protein n=1 Tax=Treponema sp. TaxID=166 RepID=UPI00298D6EED|nr:hypothetical protein [Treponema sp.]MCR5612890.1 hypothetical protein [Treponema sp.]